jgi:L-asparaginase II
VTTEHMQNPVLVEVTRGRLIESRHRGAVAVCDADGAVALAIGDIDAPVFPRSAVKAMQALPLVESGIADKLGLTQAELALACSSHAGEPAHVAGVSAMLAKAGAESDALECGAHWPTSQAAAHELARADAQPSALHNNCSGKHAGFICLVCGMGVDCKGYVKPRHAVQREIKAAIEALTGAALDADHCGTDGCSIPTYAVPLRALALGFARFGAGVGMGPTRAAAAARLRAAAAAHPFMIAGTGRFDTRIMSLLGARAFTKTGAEGVFCASFPELGLGVALKCDDGATRAAEVMMASVIGKCLQLNASESAALEPFITPELHNWNGVNTGRLAAGEAFSHTVCARMPHL